MLPSLKHGYPETSIQQLNADLHSTSDGSSHNRFAKRLKTSTQELDNRSTVLSRKSLAERLIHGAKNFEAAKVKGLGMHFRLKGTERNTSSHVFIDHSSIVGASWADIGFLERLSTAIDSGRECFAGPILNDSRNTDNAWVESRLSWSLMDDKTWDSIRGDSPVFDYQLSAGDDASGVVYHRIDSDLVENAFASHGSMFTFMAEVVPEAVVTQLEGLADYLESRQSSHLPAVRAA